MAIVIICTLARANLTAVKIMKTAGIVIAVETCGRVERILTMEMCAGEIETMQLPAVKAKLEGFFACEGLSLSEPLWKTIVVLAAVGRMMEHEAEYAAVRLWVLAEDGDSLLKGIRREPVISIYHTDIRCVYVLQCQITGNRLSAIDGCLQHMNTGIEVRTAAQDRPCVIRRAIIHAEDFNVSERLTAK